jgi:hypothetical protein
VANYFAQLPAYKNPDNAELNFAPLNNAVQNFGETSRQNVMAEYAAQRNKVADGRANRAEGRASESFDMQKTEFKQQQQDRAHKALAATFQAIGTSPAEQRAALYGQVRSSVKDFDDDVRGMGGNPDDMDSTMRLVTARATGYQPPKAPEVKEINGRLVRVDPSGASATEIYAPQAGAGNFNKDQANIEESLRKEFATLAKPYFEVRDAYSRVQQSAARPSAAGDLALIFNYMKMLDPGSVVREGEFATAQSAAGVPDRVWNLYNRILSGERLNPQQRDDFTGQARGLFQRQEQQYQGIQKQYKSITERTGVDPRNTIIDFGRPPEEMPDRQASTQPGAQGQIPPGAVQMLRSNPSPDIVQQFEAKYGPGSAQQFLAR